ncbi:HNH endonuclease [Deinococcus radiophilus]
MQGINESIEERKRAEEERQEQLREYVRQLREGNLPDVHSQLLLDPGEHCYLESPAMYTRQLKSGPKMVNGMLTVTNTRVIFTAQSGGWKVGLGNVLAVQGEGQHFNLKTGGSKGNGQLSTQGQYAGLIVESAVKLHKRLMLLPQAERASRSIPQAVKLEVWHRDHGKCVECGDTNYLEFDHVIPHSKGGATSVGNLQLLCRRCNLAKGDRL